MGKSKAERQLADNEALATARFLKTSPQKLNLVAGLIRGKTAAQAEQILSFSKRRIAGMSKSVCFRLSRMPRTTISSTSTAWL